MSAPSAAAAPSSLPGPPEALGGGRPSSAAVAHPVTWDEELPDELMKMAANTTWVQGQAINAWQDWVKKGIMRVMDYLGEVAGRQGLPSNVIELMNVFIQYYNRIGCERISHLPNRMHYGINDGLPNYGI